MSNYIGDQNDSDGNGHMSLDELAQKQVFEGVTVDMGTLRRQDGIITQAMDKLTRTNLGIIQRFITAENKDDEYRQIIKNAVWKTTEEQDKAVLAIAECRLTGATKALKIILDRLTARSAGVNGWLQIWAADALTHTTFISQNMQAKGKKYDNSQHKSSSPLA